MTVKRKAKIVLNSISAALLIGGFFCPPMGSIDGSVLAGAGVLFAWGALWVADYNLEHGADATIKHGQTEIEIKTEHDDEK